MVRNTRILQSRYCDSVVLMRVASQLKKSDDVSEVAMFMGTEGNHDLLQQAGLATPESLKAGPQDLLIIVEAKNEELCADILAQAVEMLTESHTDKTINAFQYRPRTLAQALRLAPQASLATISVPGEYAPREVRRCLRQGLNVFLFSDNVPIESERELKLLARDHNLLLMGPDCGTAYINGAGLGFANAVSPGPVGCVAASGTGLQAVLCYLDQQDTGISHGIGVGGRDLSREVGGIMTIAALEMLENDPRTEVIILLSKPPHAEVVDALAAVITRMTKPVIACFQGTPTGESSIVQAASLDEAAAMALAVLKGEHYIPRDFQQPARVASLLDRENGRHEGKRIIGLFTGGTLAKEAEMILRQGEVPASFNEEKKEGHMLLDLGDDKYTVGRPHPMIAPDIRSEKLMELAERGMVAHCGVLLCDIVLGSGSHGDPAGALVEGIELLRMKHSFSGAIVVSLVGTNGDPQDKDEQVRQLEDAGAYVFQVNSEAARMALMLTSTKRPVHFGQEVNQ